MRAVYTSSSLHSRLMLLATRTPQTPGLHTQHISAPLLITRDTHNRPTPVQSISPNRACLHSNRPSDTAADKRLLLMLDNRVSRRHQPSSSVNVCITRWNCHVVHTRVITEETCLHLLRRCCIAQLHSGIAKHLFGHFRVNNTALSADTGI